MAPVVQTKYVMKKLLWVKLLLIFGLFFSNSNNAFANEEIVEKEQIQRSDIEAFITGITEEDFEEKPHRIQMVEEIKDYMNEHDVYYFEDVASIIDKHQPTRTSNMKAKQSEDIDYNDLQEDFARIDALAQEYYEYYQIHQSFPEEDMTLRSSMSESAAIKALGNAGLKMTERQLAARLVTLGALAAIDGPLPVGDFVALVTGAIIVSEYLDNYIENQAALERNIRENEGRSYARVITDSVTMTSEIADEIKKNNVKHFRARLNSSGGVLVTTPLSLTAAKLAAKNEEETFSVRKSLAKEVVTQTGYETMQHDPHHISSRGIRPANLPHYHMLKKKNNNWEQMGGHHFYPWKSMG
ncbi:hypothetical protein [Brevibacillus sp. Leaf182]|uniref:hypothetical protein n=1 Tax=Brevibacillus sp. Leaf182 TaxID=1736290 RepID=UPI0006F2ACC8|nr:hypothetical protein [Brevibacillus sp. Leaf182]RAT96638.1 hypothetical protein ASG16_017790 [Brevibacillus sp. Leaf182]